MRYYKDWRRSNPVAGAEIIALEETCGLLGSRWVHRSIRFAGLDTKTDGLQGAVQNQRRIHAADGVDGQIQFVGSDEREALLAIDQAARRTETGATLTAEETDAKGSQRFSVSVEKLVGNMPRDVAEIWLAVTEDGLQSSVNRGENAGRTLRHTTTLRSFRKVGVARTTVKCIQDCYLLQWHLDVYPNDTIL